MAELEWFTLDLIETIGVLIVTNEKVHYVNKCLGRILERKQSEIIDLPYLQIFESADGKYPRLLKEKVGDALRTSSKQECRICFKSQYYQVQIVPKDSISVSILFTECEGCSKSCIKTNQSNGDDSMLSPKCIYLVSYRLMYRFEYGRLRTKFKQSVYQRRDF